MAVCAKCGHENIEGAKFCASCGKSLVEKAPTGPKVSLGMPTLISILVPTIFLVLAFLMRLIFLITAAQGFFEYMDLLATYGLIAVMGGVFIFAQNKKLPTVVSIMRLGITAHALLTYTFMVVTPFFVTTSRMFHIITIVLFLLMLATLVLEQLGHKLAAIFDKIIGFALPGVFFINGLMGFIYIFVFGFRNAPITLFFALSIFMTLTALTFLLATPLLGLFMGLISKAKVAKPVVVPETVVDPQTIVDEPHLDHLDAPTSQAPASQPKPATNPHDPEETIYEDVE